MRATPAPPDPYYPGLYGTPKRSTTTPKFTDMELRIEALRAAALIWQGTGAGVTNAASTCAQAEAYLKGDQ